MASRTGVKDAQGRTRDASVGDASRPLAILEQRLGAGLSRAAPLGPGAWILVCRIDPTRSIRPEVEVLADGRPDPLEATELSFRREAPGQSAIREQATGEPAPGERATGGRVVLAKLPSGAEDGRSRLEVRLRSGRRLLALGPEEVEAVTTDLRTLLRRDLADLDPYTRNELVHFVASWSDAHAAEGGAFSLSHRLHLLREALREPLPRHVGAEPRGLCVDDLLRVDETSFWVKGWMCDADARITGLSMVSPEGHRVELLERVFRYRRPDIEALYDGTDPEARHGFIGHFEVAASSRLPRGWVGEMRNALGRALEVPAPEVVRDLSAVRDTILGDLSQESGPEEGLALRHAHPALTRLQERTTRAARVDTVVQMGSPPPAPTTSIVVTLYRRTDYLQHQLAQFAHDPELREADVVYVLDSPEQRDALLPEAAQLHALYGVPFRVAVMSANAGFSGANNAGAGLARGELLLLLNSDVLPARPGWLGRMAGFYRRTPGIGALGPKLLYEDGSLQHAGLYFYRPPGRHVWENAHYFKGLHRHLPAAAVTRPVPAVTGACLMIDRASYLELGGLRGLFVQGDYEDSDLCLRLMERGRENWYLPDVELYHLEAQSYPTGLRKATRRYNEWLQTHLWGERIEELMERPWDTAVTEEGWAE